MPNITWKKAPSSWTALVDDVAVCTLKCKDIGGCTASWLDGRLWAPPSHLPKATPQPTRFFAGVEEAKSVVEQSLNS
jgi:hypothetical protein